jgi:hypothetical protein
MSSLKLSLLGATRPPIATANDHPIVVHTWKSGLTLCASAAPRLFRSALQFEARHITQLRPNTGRDSGVGLRYGRRGGRPPHRHYRTGHESFPLIRLFSHTSLCHRHSIVSDYSPTELGICAFRAGLTSGLHYAAWQRVSKTQSHPAPMLSREPVPRQHISGIARSIGFLGHPSRQGIRPGRLLHMWHFLPLRRAVDGLLRSVCPFSVTLGRHCTPHPSHRVVYPRTHVLRGRMGTFPFWACACLSSDGHQPFRRF